MCFDYGDGDYGTVLDQKYRHARKPHQCGECSRTIEVGEQFLAEVCQGTGRVWTYCTCNFCEQDRLAIVRHEINEGCGWWEAFPQGEDIAEARERYGIERATEQRDVEGIRLALGSYWLAKQSERTEAK